MYFICRKGRQDTFYIYTRWAQLLPPEGLQLESGRVTEFIPLRNTDPDMVDQLKPVSQILSSCCALFTSWVDSYQGTHSHHRNSWKRGTS